MSEPADPEMAILGIASHIEPRVGDLLRKALHAMSVKMRALEADISAKAEAFRRYVEEHSLEHDAAPGTEMPCPEDDTCECPRVLALNAAFGPGSPSATLLEEHIRALVRARNEGIERVAAHIETLGDGPLITTAARLARNIRALKEKT